MLDEFNGLYYKKGGIVIDVPFTETVILALLIANKGKILTFKMVQQEAIVDNRKYFHTIISRLRKRFAGEFTIYTKKYFGYYL